MSDRDLLLHLVSHIEDMQGKIDDMHAELEVAKPLIERWTRSKLARLTTGMGLPWQTTA